MEAGGESAALLLVLLVLLALLVLTLRWESSEQLQPGALQAQLRLPPSWAGQVEPPSLLTHCACKQKMRVVSLGSVVLPPAPAPGCSCASTVA